MKFLLLAIAFSTLALAGCPLPYEYNGKGASSHSADPSSPNMTAAVTVSYSEEGGGSGSIPDGGAFASGKTTTVTLATASLNAVIFYTDDGTTLSDLRSATKIDASSGSFTITRTTTPQSLDIHAVAVGPNMLPSPAVHFTVAVTPYPILTVTRNNATISEDGGTATFTVTSSSASTSDITVNLKTGGDYSTNYLTGLPGGPNTTFPATLVHGTTSIVFTVAGIHDPSTAGHTATLTVLADTNTPPVYTVGAPSSASLGIPDDGSHTVTYNGNGNSGGAAPTDGTFYAPGAAVTVSGAGSLVKTGYAFAGWNTVADGSGTQYAGGAAFPMPGSDMILFAQWTALPTVATPTFSPGGGTYVLAQSVAISCATSGATIRYTTDGTTPSDTVGVVYSGPITISSYTVLNAIAYKSGSMNSAFTTATYTILSSYAGPWTLTNQQGTVMGVFDMVLVAANTYHFINNPGYVWSGVYQLQGNTLVMITPDNPNYTGFIWNIDSATHLTLTNAGGGAPYAGSTAAR